MKSRISIRKIWSDNDATELQVEVCDGHSIFINKVYIGFQQIKDLIKDLNIFREHIYGGIYDIKFGEFGPEYANGGFQARLHFQVPGTLYITTQQEYDYEEFSKNEVASNAKMHIKSEPVLLDNFIAELKSMASGSSEEATLECA